MGYYDQLVEQVGQLGIWFYYRAKDNLAYEVIKDFDVSQERNPGVISDQNIRLIGPSSGAMRNP